MNGGGLGGTVGRMLDQILAAPPADPFRRHRLDLTAAEAGKWVEVRGDKWLVARLGSVASARARGEALIEMGLQPDADVPAEKVEKLRALVFANAILRGVKFAADPQVTYTKDLGLQVYQDPELRDLRDALLAEASGDYTKDAVAKAALLGNC